MASTYLQRTQGTQTENYKYTFSAWVKRTGVLGSSSANEVLLSSFSGYTETGYIRFEDQNDNLHVYDRYGSSIDLNYQTNMKFRDSNCFYHIVVNVDSTRSANQRCKIYVNGSEVSCSNTTDTGGTIGMKTSTDMRVGAINSGSGTEYYFSGLMSHVHYIDGTGYDASYFGETDSVTGEWKINVNPNVNYGNNGFFILKDGNSVTDQSGNTNNFTVSGGTLTKTEDCPSNVFCTMNPLQEPGSGQAVTFSLGNTKVAGNWSHWQRVFGTIGAKQGKWFYEFKNLQDDGYDGHCRIGWDSIDNINMTSSGQTSYYSGLTLDREGKLRGGISGHNNYDPNAVQMTSAYSGGNFSFTANDILGMAIDLDNETFSVYKNGNLEINAYSYAGLSNNSISKSRGFFIAPSYNWYSTSSNNNRSCFNFGNGYFETTAVSSAGTNASGNGIFEYDVPTGYTAWSTKGLNL